MAGRQPIARGALCFSDLRARHFHGDFAAIMLGGLRAHHGRQIEPFVGFDKINFAALAGGIHQTQLAQIITFGICIDCAAYFFRFYVSKRHRITPSIFVAAADLFDHVRGKTTPSRSCLHEVIFAGLSFLFG